MFYQETFGNEIFITDVMGALKGPINPISIAKAIALLGGKHTNNLQVRVDKDVIIGGKTFKAGTIINTGIDVAARSVLPMGVPTFLGKGKIRIGVTCALCHATVDRQTGRILEGAPNNDLDMGLILAAASNSAAMFRHTGVNPLQLPLGQQSYINADGQEAQLPNAKVLEDAVDAQALAWSPGNFDSTGTLVNNPSQNPSSYTFDAYPYGWSGHSAIGWFHGLTTLNSNVHATNSDATTGAEGSLQTLGIDKETYLGILLQNAANPTFRLSDKVKPSEFFNSVDPTPGEPALNEVIRMPGYPKGSLFMLDGLMAASPGLPVAQQLNAMSAWQNTLAPPPNPSTADTDTLKRGAKVFDRAGCISCHSGRYFTNHQVISQKEVGTQPSRANTLAVMARSFTSPQTYPSNAPVPLPANPPVLQVPTDITPPADLQLAFALSDPAGGYKVPSLIGLYVTAPYLHDGGVAAGADALKQGTDGRFQVADSTQLGVTGTLINSRQPEPEASLRLLVDRNLRAPMVAANLANLELQQANISGAGHAYWVDETAGFTLQNQTDLIQFLLSLDDDPEILPPPSS